MVTGTVTNVCVEDTVRGASATGLRVILVADACAAMRDQDHNATLHVVHRSYGDVRPTAEVLRPERPPARVGRVDAQPGSPDARPRHPGRQLVVGLGRQTAPPLLDGHAEVLDLVGLHGSEAGDLVVAEDDEAVDVGVGDLGEPPVREDVTRERVLVLREDPGQAGDRGGLLDGHHRRDVVGRHLAEDRELAGHGVSVGEPWRSLMDC